MRSYPDLGKKTKEELVALKDIVKAHNDLSIQEKEYNLALIDSHLGVKYNRSDILADIEAGSADIDDIN